MIRLKGATSPAEHGKVETLVAGWDGDQMRRGRLSIAVGERDGRGRCHPLQ